MPLWSQIMFQNGGSDFFLELIFLHYTFNMILAWITIIIICILFSALANKIINVLIQKFGSIWILASTLVLLTLWLGSFLILYFGEISLILPWEFENVPRITYDSSLSSLELARGENSPGGDNNPPSRSPAPYQPHAHFNRQRFHEEHLWIIECTCNIPITELEKFLLILQKVLTILPETNSLAINKTLIDLIVNHLFTTYDTLTNLSFLDPASRTVSVVSGVVTSIDEITRLPDRLTEDDIKLLKESSTILDIWIREKIEFLSWGPRLED